MRNGVNEPSQPPPQVECLLTYLSLAIHLNRTLIVPDVSLTDVAGVMHKWRWDEVYDIPRLQVSSRIFQECRNMCSIIVVQLQQAKPVCEWLFLQNVRRHIARAI